MNNDLITTICIENHLINQDCDVENLDAFRWFRVTNLTDEENIHYDNISPLIINAIYEDKDYVAIFALLYTNFVQRLMQYINELETVKAHNLFTIYLRDLENIYIKDTILENKYKK